MPLSTFSFEEGEALDVGLHGGRDWLFEEGEPVPDNGESTLVFEGGIGLGGAAVVLEDFEEGTSTFDDYVNSSGSWDVVTSPVFEGGFAGRHTGSRGGGGDHITSTSEDKQTSRDNTYRGWIRFEGAGMSAGFVFFVQDGTQSDSRPHGYNVVLEHGDSTFEINNNANNNTLAIVDFSSEVDTWYELEFEALSDGSLNGALYDTTSTQLTSITANNSRYDSGGFGLRHGQGAGTSYFDFARQVP